MIKNYQKLGNHRKKCCRCGKLIADGELINIEKFEKEKFYPVKGIMRFINYRYTHISCN